MCVCVCVCVCVYFNYRDLFYILIIYFEIYFQKFRYTCIRLISMSHLKEKSSNIYIYI